MWHNDLTVSDGGVAMGVGGEDAPQRSDARLVLERSVFRHRSMEVALDFLGRQWTQPHGLLHQVSIVTWVGHHLILGP